MNRGNYQLIGRKVNGEVVLLSLNYFFPQATVKEFPYSCILISGILLCFKTTVTALLCSLFGKASQTKQEHLFCNIFDNAIGRTYVSCDILGM